MDVCACVCEDVYDYSEVADIYIDILYGKATKVLRHHLRKPVAAI